MIDILFLFGTFWLCVGIVAFALRLLYWHQISRDYKGQTLTLRTEDGNTAEYVCTSACCGRLKLEPVKDDQDIAMKAVQNEAA